MNKFSSVIENKIMPIASKVGSNTVLSIIRNAMCSIMSLLIIGSICVLLTNFPISEVANVLKPAYPFLNAVSATTSSMMGLFTAAGMAYYASDEYKTDMFASILTAVSTFLLTQITAEGTLNIDGLGSNGILTAMVVGFVTVKMLQIFKEKNLVIKMPDGVPPAVAESFSSLIPAIVVMVIFGTITLILGFNINEIMTRIMSPVATIVNNPFGYAIYHMLCGLVFFCGINSVVVGVVLPLILQNGAANEAAFLAGEAMPFIATKSTDILIWSGGTGATIGLVLLMSFFAKSKSYKTLGRMSLAPSIFNINEPVIFGTPICFNPIFFVPFVFIPGVLAFLTYFLIDIGIVTVPVASVIPWTIPPIMQGVLMGNGDISLIIWSIFVVVISLVGFYPFFRYADKQEYKKEQGNIEA